MVPRRLCAQAFLKVTETQGFNRLRSYSRRKDVGKSLEEWVRIA